MGLARSQNQLIALQDRHCDGILREKGTGVAQKTHGGVIWKEKSAREVITGMR